MVKKYSSVGLWRRSVTSDRYDHEPGDDHTESITGLSACSRLKLYASSSLDGTIRIWNDTNTLIRYRHTEIFVPYKTFKFFSMGLNIVTLFLIVRLYTLKDFVHYFLIKVLDMHSLGVQLAQLILWWLAATASLPTHLHWHVGWLWLPSPTGWCLQGLWYTVPPSRQTTHFH